MNRYLEQYLSPTLERFMYNCINTPMLNSIKYDERVDIQSIYGYTKMSTMYYDGILLSLLEGDVHLQYAECNNSYAATTDLLQYYILVEERWDGYESEFIYCDKSVGMYDFKNNLKHIKYISPAAKNSHDYAKEFCNRISTHEMTYFPICGLRRD